MADADRSVLISRLHIGRKAYDVSLTEELLSWKLFQVNPSQRPLYHHLNLGEIITADFSSKLGASEQRRDQDSQEEESVQGYQRIHKTNSLKEEPTTFTVHAVKRSGRRKWRLQEIKFRCPDTHTCKHWVAILKQTIAKQETQRPKKLIVFINPVGGKCQAKDIYYNKVAPLFELADVETEVIITETSSHAKDHVLGLDVEKVDGIVCVGGDGTVAEVVNALLIRTQKSNGIDINDANVPLSSPNLRIGVIPAGSTDVIAYGTTGVNDPFTSAMQIVLGYSLGIDVCSIHSNNELVRYNVCMLSYGFYGDVLKDSENYRWIGPHRYEVAGAKKYLRNQSYCGEVSFLPSTDEDHNPWDKATCRVGCSVCFKRQGSQASLHGQEMVALPSPTQMQSSTDPDTKWKTVWGDFICINAALMSGICGKSPHGVSPTAHLGNGCVDLMLVRKCSRINYLRHLLRLASGANHFDFDFVEVHRVKAFKFRPLRSEDLVNKEVSYQRGHERVTMDSLLDKGSHKPLDRIHRQGSMTSISSWNIDGEIGDMPDVDVRVHCQTIKVFARGRESVAEIEESIKCCSFSEPGDTLS